MLIKDLLEENNRRKDDMYKRFNPRTGEGSVGERELLYLPDFPIKTQYIPKAMCRKKLIVKLREYGSVENFLLSYLHVDPDDIEQEKEKVVRRFVKLRCEHDFPFWCILFVIIKDKESGESIHFKLNYPQRILVSEYERQRLENIPIRLILLKARQWGGSTVTQLYMSWIQLMHKKGWNSIIVAHLRDASLEIKGMFSTMMENYDKWMLYEEGETIPSLSPTLVSFEGAVNIDIIPQRNCKIKIGTAQQPESARSGDSALAHCSEVAFWTKTKNKTPKQIVRAACSAIAYIPMTMIVFESTANGTGNYFHEEWLRAKKGTSNNKPLFIPWYQIERYSMDIPDLHTFCVNLIMNKDSDKTDAVYGNGKYNWWLWEKGARLEAIYWYTQISKDSSDHADVAAEYPTDDIEAFAHSGKKVFDRYRVEELRKRCKDPEYVGDIVGDDQTGEKSLKNIRFNEKPDGLFRAWSLPDTSINMIDRYLVVVDVGGRSDGSDFSNICVLDRYWMIDGDKPEIVADWYGHVRHDILAWKAAQIAKFYCTGLLIIESNTLETKDQDTDGDHTEYILNLIKEHYGNIYARKQTEQSIKEGAPVMYGFHTNRFTKPALIDNLVKVIDEQAYIERDDDTINEYHCYEKKQNGSFGAIEGKHDDKLMTRGIALYVCFCELPQPYIIEERKKSVTNRKPHTEATL